MKIALGQMRVYANDMERNYLTIKSMVADYEDLAEVIVFPELALSGISIGDAFLNKETLFTIDLYNEKVVALSEEIDIIFGTVVEGYNAAIVAKEGKVVEVIKKKELVDAGVFNESRYFKEGSGPQEITLGNTSVVVALGNDPVESEAWTVRLSNHIYEHDRLDTMHPLTVEVRGVGLANNGKNVYGLDGGSYVSHEEKARRLNDAFEAEVSVIDVKDFTHHVEPLENKLYHSLIKIIQLFDEENLSYKPKWLVGVSGGLDSSLSVALLTLALGSDRVLGVTMPGEYTRDITKSNAYHLSKHLNFELLEIPIHKMVEATHKSLNDVGYDKVQGLTHENIQARLRGHTLMSMASLVNGVVSNNGNKIETALGYATMYGDSIGALSLLGDLDKLEVGALCQSINEAMDAEVIPSNLIPIPHETYIEWEFAPSAELAKDQFDPMKWGYHDALIPYLIEEGPLSALKAYRDRTHTKWMPYLDAYGLHKPEAFIKDLEWVVRTLKLAVFKRVQSPPILKVSKNSFGLDYLEYQGPTIYSKEYEALKEALLK